MAREGIMMVNVYGLTLYAHQGVAAVRQHALSRRDAGTYVPRGF